MNINWDVIMPVVIAILIALLIFAIFKRALRVVVAVLLIALIFPVAVTILCGEGEGYVEKFASLFSPKIGQGIMDFYKGFAEDEKKDPVISEMGINTAFQNLWDKAKDAVAGLIPVN